MVWSSRATLLAGVVAAVIVPLAGMATARAQSKPTFEVVELKVWKTGEHPSSYTNIVERQDPGRVWAQYAPLSSLLRYAFHLGVGAAVEGEPAWGGATLRDFRTATMFSVDARLPANTSDEQSRLMMQTLLERRFQMAWHWTRKPMKVLEMTAPPGEFKLHPPDAARDKMEPAGPFKGCPKDVNGCAMRIPQTMTMGALAASLPRVVVGLPVVDKTGLSGEFHVPRMVLLLAGERSAFLPGAVAELHQVTGLELREATEMLPVLVIDHVEMPSGSSPAGR